jgi:hypothetical protein
MWDLEKEFALEALEIGVGALVEHKSPFTPYVRAAEAVGAVFVHRDFVFRGVLSCGGNSISSVLESAEGEGLRLILIRQRCFASAQEQA